MQQMKRRLLALAEAVDVPREVLTGDPMIEIKGFDQTVIIHHRGLLSYTETEICVATALGAVEIRGRGLKIGIMNRERIGLLGQISSVSIKEREV